MEGAWIRVAGPYIPGSFAGWRVWCQFLPPGATRFFCNIAPDLVGPFFVALLMRNLYTGDPYEGVWSLPSQAKCPSHGPAGNHGNTKPSKQ